MTVFNIINYLTFDKKPYSELDEEEIKCINVWMINRILSMRQEYCLIVNNIQSIPNISPEMLYNIYLRLLPKSKKYVPYIKARNSNDNPDIKFLSDKLEISSRELNEYFKFLTKEQIDEYIQYFGGNVVEGKTPKSTSKRGRPKK